MMADNTSDLAEEIERADDEGETTRLDLIDIWDSSREPFDEWVQSISRAFYESKFGIESAAKFLDTSSGELSAVLSLATMEEEKLELLAEDVPPKTTWFTFAGATLEEIEVGLEALESKSSDDSAHAVVKGAMRELRGPTPEEQVADLPGEVFYHMSTKAKQYDLLSGQSRSFLYQMGRVRSSDNEMSPAQADYACDVLKQMADNGAISRDSPDDDQEKCDKVLDALGR